MVLPFETEIRMDRIEVVAAVIRKDGMIFATQRGYGEQKDGWEFPGGKVEKDEDFREALTREIREELEVEILPGEEICAVEYDYPNISIRLTCYWAELTEGSPVLLEHEAARWLSMEEIDSVGWLPADRLVLPYLTESV